MTRARKPCGTPGCANLAPCPEHAPKPWAGSTRSRRLPSYWAKRRRFILDRDPICRICDAALAVEVDHVIPNDDHDVDNLQGVCKKCHALKSSAEGIAARAGR